MKKLILIEFEGGFRIGRGDESDSTLPTIHSDTIHGALVYWAFKLNPEEAENFAKSLKCSSLIFQHMNDFLIPKPLILDSLSLENPKRLKNANYVYLSKLSLKNPEESALMDQPVIVTNIPRNALDRNTNKSMFYFVEVAHVKPDYVPCIILEFADTYERLVVECLRILADSGIGGDSTYGFGLFNFEIADLPELFERSGKYHCTLSLSIPNVDEIEKLNEGYYRILRKRGFKKDVVQVKADLNYLSEGSTFPFPIKGRGLAKIEDYFIQTSPITVAFGGDEV
ncbi:type III-A CRISPR-associated RAMP protein Csm4 [Pseudothermotoga sp.]|uniref:type III-A CRISPR-associated RAMP protein Csm4 n=1 Tax=Pseudothermotoga sp. TaxID=2033661 RepID=UPI0031F70260